MSLVSVILVGRANPEQIARSIDACEAGGSQASCEYLVFDDAAWRHLQTAPEVRLLRAQSDPAEARNAAARNARGGLLCFLDPALCPRPGWLDSLRKTLDAQPDCGIVGGCVLNRDGTIQHAGIAFDQDSVPRRAFAGFPVDAPALSDTFECEAVPEAAALIRRELFSSIGGFDPHSGIPGVDLCLRIRQRGLKVVFCRSSRFESAPESPTDGLGPALSLPPADLRRFLRKWRDSIDTLRLPEDLTWLRPYGYYHDSRADLISLIPEASKHLLDIGCGAGMFGEMIKRRSPGVTVWGVEINEEMARKARSALDRVVVADMERLDFSDFPAFDCIVFADVLEHMKDPWRILRRLHAHLAADGRLVASIPNVRFHRVVIDLIRGRWSYRPEGILDVDHIRFYTLASLRSLFLSTGYEIERIERNRKSGLTLRVMNRLLRGIFDDVLTKKYLLVCRKRSLARGSRH